jgi:uncharacterized membrane protein
VANPLLATIVESESIVVMSVIYMPVLERKIKMNKEQMDAEFDYRVSLGIAKNLLSEGLLTKPEYEKLKRLMLRKYTPIISSLDG